VQFYDFFTKFAVTLTKRGRFCGGGHQGNVSKPLSARQPSALTPTGAKYPLTLRDLRPIENRVGRVLKTSAAAPLDLGRGSGYRAHTNKAEGVWRGGKSCFNSPAGQATTKARCHWRGHGGRGKGFSSALSGRKGQGIMCITLQIYMYIKMRTW